jgi:hypothetical protein
LRASTTSPRATRDSASGTPALRARREQHVELGLARDVGHSDFEQETIQLRQWQWICTGQIQWILGGNNKE